MRMRTGRGRLGLPHSVGGERPQSTLPSRRDTTPLRLAAESFAGAPPILIRQGDPATPFRNVPFARGVFYGTRQRHLRGCRGQSQPTARQPPESSRSRRLINTGRRRTLAQSLLCGTICDADLASVAGLRATSAAFSGGTPRECNGGDRRLPSPVPLAGVVVYGVNFCSSDCDLVQQHCGLPSGAVESALSSLRCSPFPALTPYALKPSASSCACYSREVLRSYLVNPHPRTTLSLSLCWEPLRTVV